MRGTVQLPTVEVRLPIKLADMVDKKSITKTTKTYVLADVDYTEASKVRDRLQADLAAKGIKPPEVKRLRKALDVVRPALRAVAEQTSDVTSFSLEQHPIGALVPPMTKAEVRDLTKSIKEQGFLPAHPIIVHDGQILDGWHRYLAANKLKVVPVFKDYVGSDPAGFVMSVNLHRRHLTDDQRSVIAGQLASVDKKMTTAQAAAAVNVRARKAGQARRVANASPALAEAVRLGQIKLSDAARVKDDDELIKRLNDEEITVEDVIAEAVRRGQAKRVPAVKLSLDGSEAWEHFDVVFDANGESIGEAYVRPLPTPLEDIDTNPILEKIAEVTDWSLEKKVVRAGLRDHCEPREVQALFRDFEGVDPSPDMSRSKLDIAVANHLIEWFASAEDDEDDEGDEDAEEADDE